MQKIKLEINHAELVSFLGAYELFKWSPDINPSQKAIKAICDELYSKLYKKEIDKRENPRDFTLNLKYYQAHAIHHFTAITFVLLPKESFERNAIREINRQIDQQL